MKLVLWWYGLFVLFMAVKVDCLDIFDIFHRAQQQQQQQRHQKSDGNKCPDYLCHMKLGPCVKDPSECPCREGEYRCELGSHSLCVASKDDCKWLETNV